MLGFSAHSDARCSSLQTAGLIRYRRGHIEILDRDGLEEAGLRLLRN